MLFAFLALAASPPPLSVQAQQTLADQTSNPSVVQFRNVRVVGITVCGEFNAPNETGGFHGFTRFAFQSPETWVYGFTTSFTMRDQGRFVSTARLWEQMMRYGGARRSVEDWERSREFQAQHDAADRRAEELLAVCA